MAYARSSKSFPPWDDRPRIRPDLVWVWRAFQELQTCRPVGMGMGPIPWTAIQEWADAEEIADTERFRTLIRAMDRVVLDKYLEDRDDDG